MKKIWAPWRSKYIYLRKRKGCIFCKAAKVKKDEKHFVVERTPLCFSMLNIYPYNNGHLMVAPYRHKTSLIDFSQDELCDLIILVKKSLRLIDKVLKPDGYNLGFNIGKIAGAGFAGHLHMHIVPRWQGDTNFMPVLTQTKIMSESLDSLYRRLKSAKI
ncbi:MAG: HIT domain-containing protein [Candidatus Omnitrophota bacterium]|nr:MAG: HIT domain-containing protein [Candidatus Omnitrophota bacterium]